MQSNEQLPNIKHGFLRSMTDTSSRVKSTCGCCEYSHLQARTVNRKLLWCSAWAKGQCIKSCLCVCPKCKKTILILLNSSAEEKNLQVQLDL